MEEEAEGGRKNKGLFSKIFSIQHVNQDTPSELKRLNNLEVQFPERTTRVISLIEKMMPNYTPLDMDRLMKRYSRSLSTRS